MSINNICINRPTVTAHNLFATALKAQPIQYLLRGLFFLGIIFSGKASAYVLLLSDVSDGYSNCSYTDNGTSATFGVTINYKAAAGRLGGNLFLSRGVLIYTYSDKGVLQNSSSVPDNVSMNGDVSNNFFDLGDYIIYKNANASQWSNPRAFSADIKFTVVKSKIAGWPAVGVRAGNFTGGDDVGEIMGVAYIGPSTTAGSCTVAVNPETPPPAVNPEVTMTAPDWDLGELPRGLETILSLPTAKDLLCFTYEGSTAITNQKYLINATNSNGLSADGQYLLTNLKDSSQTVPYTLTLANTTDSVLLPNTQNRLFSLDAGGRTCFTPTFKVHPDKTVKGGAYSDILTFTLVAKP